jgi:hypothetical protein
MRVDAWLAIAVALCTLEAFSQTAQHLTSYEVRQHLFNGVDDASANEDPLLQSSTPRKKTTGLAAIYSLLLPGMGELYAEGFESGKYFLIAEGALWLTYASFEIYGNQIADDARAYAQAHAGINLVRKDEQYFVDIGNFRNITEFNQKQLRDYEFSRVYSNTALYHWEWDTEASRALYRDQRVASDNMLNNRKFVIAAIVINHIGSAINAVRSAINYNKSLDEQLGSLSMHAEVLGGLVHAHGIKVTLTKTF